MQFRSSAPACGNRRTRLTAGSVLAESAGCIVRPLAQASLERGYSGRAYQKDGGAVRRAALRRDQPEDTLGLEMRCS